MTSGHFYWNKETIEELLSKEDVTPEEINRTDAAGNTALKQAILMHDIPALEQLLKKEGIIVNAPRGQDSPLNLAIIRNNLPAVELLLQHKSVNITAGRMDFDVNAIECATSISCIDYTGAHSRDMEDSRNLIIKRLLDKKAEYSLVKTVDGRVVIDAKNTLYHILSCNSGTADWYSLVKTFIEHPKVDIKVVRTMHDIIYKGNYSNSKQMIEDEEKKRSRSGDKGSGCYVVVPKITTMCPPLTDGSTGVAPGSNATEPAPFSGAGGPGTASATHASGGGGAGSASGGTAPSTWIEREADRSGGAKGK